MVAQVAASAVRVATTGGSRLLSRLLAAACPRRSASHGARIGREPDADRIHMLHVVRLYRLVLERLPDHPGLRHHAELLAGGSTLAELASSLLAVSRSADGDRRQAASVLWNRAGGESRGFEAAWQAARGLADFTADLVRHPPRRDPLPLTALFADGIDPAPSDGGSAWAYRLWAGEVDAALNRLAARMLGLLRLFGPRIVLVLPLDGDVTAAALDATVAALSRQIYGRWRLLLDGALPPDWVPPADPRIRHGADPSWPGGGIGSRRILQGVLRAGDLPAPSCLALFALAALRRPSATCWRCDEDRIDTDGRRSRPRLDRDAGLVLERRPGRGLQTLERHLPAVLLHRSPMRSGIAPGPVAASGPVLPTASLVIVTRDRPLLLRRCLHSIRATTGAPGASGAPEIVIVDNGTEDADALEILQGCVHDGCVVLRRPGPFNWSALCNAGVRASTGAVAVLLNNDIECVRADWLPVLLFACADPAVGVVGAKLLFEPGRVQHNGVLVGPGPVAAHRLDGAEPSDAPVLAVSAVTGACMAFRRTVFDRLGGLEEALPVTWNDLDFCFRAREIGLAVQVATGCVLHHDELGTRTPDTAPENRAQLAHAQAFIRRRHRAILKRERFLHPLLLFNSGARALDPRAPSRIARMLLGGGVGCENGSGSD